MLNPSFFIAPELTGGLEVSARYYYFKPWELR